MITLIDVVAAEDLQRVRKDLAALSFRDGRATAGPAARRVKANEQARGDDPKAAALGRFVRQALERHPVFPGFVRPARWSTVMFSRYGPGHAYGLHTDDAAMRDEDGGRLRTDLSFTLFLSDPADYDGGALLIDGLDGEREHRPPAGSAVIYQTGQLHRVTAVTRGERLAAVGWVQSLIRRADQRELLFDLDRARGAMPDGDERLLLDKSIGNLLRMWAET